jgi:mycothiol synthase
VTRRVDAAGFPDAAELVRRVVAASDAADGVGTLNEQATLELKNHGLDRAALWVDDDGFALLRGQSLDIAVHPDSRGRGIGTRLAAAALEGLGHVDAWSHADHPAAQRLAARFGVPRARELHIMGRPTSMPLEAPPSPAGVRVRGFTDADRDDVLRINAAAFAHHPEQGDMDAADFVERTSEDWFDPAGLLLAVDDDADGAVLGFHWTKVHREGDPPYGEVYVVAVDPAAAGRGLGKLLTHAGLAHLAGQGLGEVILYVDGDNDPAIALYRGLGFRDVRVEAQYRGAPTLP